MPERSHCSKSAVEGQRWNLLETIKKRSSFWKRVLWSVETKIELFWHNDECYVCEKKQGEAFHPNITIPTAVGMFRCSAGTGQLQNVDEIMRKEKYLEMLKHDSNHQPESWSLGASESFNRATIPSIRHAWSKSDLQTTSKGIGMAVTKSIS